MEVLDEEEVSAKPHHLAPVARHDGFLLLRCQAKAVEIGALVLLEGLAAFGPAQAHRHLVRLGRHGCPTGSALSHTATNLHRSELRLAGDQEEHGRSAPAWRREIHRVRRHGSCERRRDRDPYLERRADG